MQPKKQADNKLMNRCYSTTQFIQNQPSIKGKAAEKRSSIYSYNKRVVELNLNSHTFSPKVPQSVQASLNTTKNIL